MPRKRETEPEKLKSKLKPEGEKLEEFSEQRREKELTEIKAKILKNGFAGESEARLLAGDNSEEAWKIRETILTDGKLYTFTSGRLKFSPLAASIYGMNEERAWTLRDKLIDAGENTYWNDSYNSNMRHFHSVEAAKSTLGVVSERANNIRKKALEDGEHLDDSPFAGFRRQTQREEASRAVLFSLMGQDTEDAWQLRDEAVENCFKDRERDEDESEEYKDELRFELLLDNIIGLDSDRAWQIREEYMEKEIKGKEKEGSRRANLGDLLETLTGLDNDRAWEIREEALEELKALKKREEEDADRKKEYWKGERKRLEDCLADSIMGISSPRTQEMLSLIGGVDKRWDFRTEGMLGLILKTRDKISQQKIEKQDLEEAKKKAERAFEEET